MNNVIPLPRRPSLARSHADAAPVLRFVDQDRRPEDEVADLRRCIDQVLLAASVEIDRLRWSRVRWTIASLVAGLGYGLFFGTGSW